jgi:hypothetical protein
MSDIKFHCPACGGKLGVDTQAAGYFVPCPLCHQRIQIPRESAPLPPKSAIPATAAPAAAEGDELTRLKERVHYLEKEKAELQMSLLTAEQRNQSLARLEMKTADLLQELEQMAMEHTEAKQSNQQFEIEKNALKEHIADLSAQLEQRQGELDSLRTQLETAGREQSREHASVETALAEAASMREEIRSLELQLAESRGLKDKVAALELQLTEARAGQEAARQLREEKESLATTLRESADRVKALEQQADTLRQERDQARLAEAEVRRLETELGQRPPAEDVARDIAGMKAQMEAAERAAAETRAENDELKKHLQSVAAEFVQFRKEKSSTTDTLSGLHTELEVLKAALAESEETRKALQARLHAANTGRPETVGPADGDALRRQLEEARAGRQQTEQECAKLRSSLEQSELARASLSEALQKVQRNGNETEEIRKQLVELRTQVEESNTRLTETRKDAAAVIQERDRLLETVKDSRRTLVEKEEYIAKLSAQSDQRALENQSLNAELKTLREQSAPADAESTGRTRPPTSVRPKGKAAPSRPAGPEAPEPPGREALQQLIRENQELRAALEKAREEAAATPAEAPLAAAAEPSLYRRARPSGFLSQLNAMALPGASICLAAAAAIMILSPESHFVFAPLFALAVVLVVMGMAPRKQWVACTLLPATLLAPWLIGWAGPQLKEWLARERAAKPAPTATSPMPPPAAPVERTEPAPLEPRIAEMESPSAEIGAGQSTVIDGVRITLRNIRIGRIDRIDPAGNLRPTDKDYLLIDLDLHNTSASQSVFLHGTWDQSRLTDDRQNTYRPAFPSRFSVDQIVGTISAAELKPGQSLSDVVIFEQPVDAVEQFTLFSDPGFWKKTGEGYTAISRSVVKMSFRRGDIQTAPPAP